ncbi:MAG: restriction endonuclease subunit S [Actinomycetota bacterium]
MTEAPVRPLSAVAEVTLGRQRSPENHQGPSMVPYLRAANVTDGRLDLSDVQEMNFSPDEQRIFELRDGDVLITEGSGSLTAVGASAVWRSEIGGRVCFQNTLLRVRPRTQRTDPRFLAWWCRHAFTSGLFASIATGANIHHLSAERMRALPVCAPALQEQERIADFLDVETPRIDALIEKKRLLLALLEERMNLAVRHILGSLGAPSVPLKRFWTVIDCKHRTPTYLDSGFPVVSPGDATPGRLDLGRCTRFIGEEDFADLAGGQRRPRRGDIVYSRNASVGIACYVDSGAPFSMGQDVCLIRSATEDQLFLTYVLNSLGADQLELAKIGSTFSRVNVAQVLEIQVPRPSPAVQVAVAGELDRQFARHASVRELLLRQIALLHEHRQALITAAVTGELSIERLAA